MTALRHRVPDLVPAQIRNMPEWERHAAYFGLATWEELLDSLGNTIVSFVPAYGEIQPAEHAVSLPQIWGLPEEVYGTYTDTIARPLAHAETVADVEAYPWPDNSRWDFAGMRARLLTDSTHARMSAGWTPVFSRLCELFGMERAMVNLLWNRPVIEAALDRLDAFYTGYFTAMLETCGDQLEILGLGDDFAGNHGLLIAPELWRSLFKPFYAKWLAMGKSRGLVTYMHACGNLIEVLPDLIDSGLDAWQTVQTHLPGQEPQRLKSEFGRHLAFVGAIDTSNVLGRATPEEVKAHVYHQIVALGEGGGYVCAPDHTIMEGTPSANVAALYATIAAFRAPGYTLAP
jgi:uroporphyrinogen decarboxylase